MTPEEKIIFYIREGLIEKYGNSFIQLSEKAQNDLIAFEIQQAIKQFKNGK